MDTTERSAAVAANIRGQLARHKQRQEDLGNRLDLPRSSISRRLSGETPFTVGELLEAADFFGVTPGDLLTEA